MIKFFFQKLKLYYKRQIIYCKKENEIKLNNNFFIKNL